MPNATDIIHTNSIDGRKNTKIDLRERLRAIKIVARFANLLKFVFNDRSLYEGWQPDNQLRQI